MCSGCRQIYAARTPPEAPPCATCRVECLPENEEVAEVFALVRRQVVTVGGTPVDLDLRAVLAAMALLGVTDPRTCLQRVRHLWHATDGKPRCA